MKRRRTLTYLGLALLTVVAILIAFPTVKFNFNLFGKNIKGTIAGPDLNFTVPLTNIKVNKQIKIWEGLDLKGGIRLVYQADMTPIKAADRATKLNEVVAKIENRINKLGVTEPIVQSSISGDNYRVQVEIPGINNVDEAKKLIGTTAQLDFRELQSVPANLQATDANGNPVSATQQMAYVPVGLTGNDFYRAYADIDRDQNSKDYNKPIVRFEFNDSAVQKFSDLTQRLSTSGGYLAVFLDNQLIFGPATTTHIADGKGQITGMTDANAVKTLSIELNEGALPVQITTVSEEVISPTLGSDSIRKSLIAGVIGMLAVCIMMIWYYHLPGAVAVVALFLYTLFSISIFKLVPVTMTLSGIAAFILSVGMAVDANILIFERFKEELRLGKTLHTALDVGFKRAWTSVRDSNVSSLITCFILYYFGSGTIRGFAFTLALGILISLFTAITVTRNLLDLVLSQKVFHDLSWYGINKKEN